MAYTECSVNYKRMKILDLSTFSGGIVAGYYKNTSVFTSPPLSKAQFQALAKDVSGGEATLMKAIEKINPHFDKKYLFYNSKVYIYKIFQYRNKYSVGIRLYRQNDDGIYRSDSTKLFQA